jgi:hypothetical protein
MGECVQFFSQSGDFLDILFVMLGNTAFQEILISGTWDGVTYRQIVDKVMSSSYANKVRMIIPNILNKGTLSRPMINKIIRSGGRISINNSFSNNMIIIGGSAFIASYSYKRSFESENKHYFESCIFTDCENTVNEIKKSVEYKWNKSYPLVMEETMGDSI